MVVVYSLLALAASYAHGQFQQVDTQTTKGSCTLSVQIAQSAIPLTISQPGSYCVIENLTVSAPQRAAIIIDSNNVTLDLNDSLIQGANGNTASGIIINQRNNITIRNGTIANMFNSGISIINGAQGITFQGITCINNSTGFALSGIIRCFFSDCLSVLSVNNGFFIGQAGAIVSQNLVFNNCFSTQNAGNGFSFINCLNVQLENCTANNNLQTGFNHQNSSRMYYTECIANSNSGNGFTINGGTTNILDNCSAENNSLTGFTIAGTRQTISHCEASGNTTSGFAISNNNHVIIENIAKANTTFGLLLNTNTTECQVRNNTSVANGTGFQNNGTSNRIYTNFANNNTTANFAGVPNVSVSPTILTAINSTANIEN